MSQRVKAFLTLCFLLFVPSVCFANAGVPMIFLELPVMVIALIPVILIETVVFKNGLKTDSKKTVWAVGFANMVSTFFGYPLSWALRLGVELLTTGGSSFGLSTIRHKIVAVTLQSAWLIPYESDLNWMIPLSAMFGLIPAFFISVYSEYLVIKRFFGESPERVKRLSWTANSITYIILLLFCVGLLIYGIASK